MDTLQQLSALFVLCVAVTVSAADGKEEPKLKLSDEEQAILKWTNEVRAKEKVPALAAHPQLFAVARAHSANMAKQRKLAHDLDGKDIEKRILDVAYDYAEIGENLAGGDGSVLAFFKLWIESPIHREHIVKRNYREIGIAVARDDKGQLYATVVFGVQRPKR